MSNLFSGHETALKRHGYDDTSGGIIKKLYSYPDPLASIQNSCQSMFSSMFSAKGEEIYGGS